VTAIDRAAFDRGQLGENIGDTPAQNSETFAFILEAPDMTGR
jgi:hypothetical protein